MVFPVVTYRCESWTIKKAEHRRTDAFRLWCWGRLLRVPWKARRPNQSILKKSTLNTHWKDGCWSWSSKTLATWYEQLTHWKRPWCREWWKEKGEEFDRDRKRVRNLHSKRQMEKNKTECQAIQEKYSRYTHEDWGQREEQFAPMSN